MLTMRPKRRATHAVDRLPEEEDWCQHVFVDGADPGVAFDVTEISRRRAAGIVDENVGLRSCCEHGTAPLFGGDVGRHSDHADAGLSLDVFRKRNKRRFAACIDNEVDTLPRERNRNGAAQSTRCRANDGRLAAYAEIHVVPLLTVFGGAGSIKG